MGKQDLRRRNTHLLLSILQAEGPNSQAELARRSGLSAATVSGILQPLIESRFLVEEGKSTTGRGRRASILAFNSQKAVSVGISIDHDRCNVALVDFSGRVLDRGQAGYARFAGPDEVAGLAADCLTSLLERNHINRESIPGVGIASPGLINRRAGLVQVATNLGWHNVQLRSLFEQRLGFPVRIDHLGRAHVRAEAIWGRGKGHRNFICLEIGTGIGAGVMVRGRVLRGEYGIAGEVGHIPIDPSGPLCACGLKGCWEAMCAAPAIRRRLALRLEASNASRTALSAASTLADLNAADGAGDPLASEVIRETADYLTRGLAAIIWTFDPEFILLTGTVVSECPNLIAAAKASLGQINGVRRFDIPLIPHGEQDETGDVAASSIISSRYLEELAENGALTQVHLQPSGRTEPEISLLRA